MAGGSIQNAGSGAINLVAGWDGHTLSGFGASGVAGNGGKGVTIGGANAEGNVAVGSAGGATSVYGASLAITATNGYAQLGFNGHGSGAILVNVSGALSMTGGSGTGQFAQIGNGGLKTSGNNSGDITISAGGTVTLTGGTGTEAYVQIGHGGAESNTGARQGYSNTGNITVTGQDVLLNAGTGAAAYVQIGNGGYKVGAGITGGTATNGGNISITSAHTVSLQRQHDRRRADAYMQIGNGGGQSNLNPAAAAGGTDSGDITVSAPNGAAGSVTLIAGLGANSYAMIGNGGYAVEFRRDRDAGQLDDQRQHLGHRPVADRRPGHRQRVLADRQRRCVEELNRQRQRQHHDQRQRPDHYTNGKAPTSLATIGNFTGTGTTSGTLTGASPPSQVNTDPVVIGITTVNTADNNNNNGNNNITTINTTFLPPQDTGGVPNMPSPSGVSHAGRTGLARQWRRQFDAQHVGQRDHADRRLAGRRQEGRLDHAVGRHAETDHADIGREHGPWRAARRPGFLQLG